MGIRLRYDKNNIPIVSKSDIDVIAERLLKDFMPESLKVPMAVDVEMFIEDFLGITLDYRFLSNNQSILGMAVFSGGFIDFYNPEHNDIRTEFVSKNTIIIDSSLAEQNNIQRGRFSCGHEAGHIVFHPEYFCKDKIEGQLSFFDVSKKPSIVGCRTINDNYFYTKQWTNERRIEWQADSFAAALLMPKSMVLKVVDSFDKIDAERMTLEIHNVFDASKKAAYYRLCNLNITETPLTEGMMKKQLRFDI